MPSYAVMKKTWDNKKNEVQETIVKETSNRELAVSAYREILHSEKSLSNQDLDFKDKKGRAERRVQGLFFKDGIHQDRVQGQFVDKTFIFIHPEENMINIERKTITFKDRIIVSLLGAGRNGFVLECVDTRLDLNLAIKIWLKGEYALFEAKKLSQAEHENVLNIKYSGVLDGYNYAELDLINGKSLREWLSVHRPFQQRALIAKQIIETLDQIHYQDIYHGDLHPDNIIITPDKKIKILDFGTSVRSGKDLSDHRASWILVQTMYELLGSEELEPYLKIFHPNIQYFIREKKWREIRREYKDRPFIFPAEYVNASFDFIVEFLMAKEISADTEDNEYLLSDLASFLMRSPFINIENLFDELSLGFKTTEIYAFINSMYASTFFEAYEYHALDDNLVQLIKEIPENEDVHNDFYKYYNLQTEIFLEKSQEFRAWRVNHMEIMKKRRIQSLTITGI